MKLGNNKKINKKQALETIRKNNTMSRHSETSNEGTCLLSQLCNVHRCGCLRGERSSTSNVELQTGRTSRRSHGPGLLTPRCFGGICDETQTEELRSQSIYSCFKELDRLRIENKNQISTQPIINPLTPANSSIQAHQSNCYYNNEMGRISSWLGGVAGITIKNNNKQRQIAMPLASAVVHFH